MVQVVDLTDGNMGNMQHKREMEAVTSQKECRNGLPVSGRRQAQKNPMQGPGPEAKLHNIPQEVSLYHSVSDKTYVTITAKLLHIIRRKKTSKKVGTLGWASIDSGLGVFRKPILY